MITFFSVVGVWLHLVYIYSSYRHYSAWVDASWRISPQHCYLHTMLQTKICLCVILICFHRKSIAPSAQKMNHSLLNWGTAWINLFQYISAILWVSWHATCTWRELLKLQLLANVDVVIVLGPLSGSFSWQPQMVLPDYRATPPHAAAMHHAITVGNGIIWLLVVKGCTEDQKSVGRHYPPPLLHCILMSECSSIWSWGMFVIYFCIDMLWLVSTENVREEDFRKAQGNTYYNNSWQTFVWDYLMLQ